MANVKIDMEGSADLADIRLQYFALYRSAEEKH